MFIYLLRTQQVSPLCAGNRQAIAGCREQRGLMTRQRERPFLQLIFQCKNMTTLEEVTEQCKSRSIRKQGQNKATWARRKWTCLLKVIQDPQLGHLTCYLNKEKNGFLPVFNYLISRFSLKTDYFSIYYVIRVWSDQ